MKIQNLKKKHQLALALFSAALSVNSIPASAQTTNNPAPYCMSKFFGNFNMFNNLKIKNVKLDFGPMGSWTAPNDYGYYNVFTFPTVNRGESVTFELNVYSVNNAEPAYFALWVDFNRNNSFEAGEMIMHNANTTNARLPVMGAPVAPIIKQITIPASATLGKTRARLTRSMSNDALGPYDPNFRLNPCNEPTTTSFGNTYDFDIVIGNATTGIAETGVPQIAGKVFPNPANGQITVLLENPTAAGTYRITDLMGRIAKQGNLSQGKAAIALTDLPGSIYNICIRTEDGVLSQNIVVAH